MAEELKFYLTKEGLEKIKKEYESLKKLKLAKSYEESPKLLHSEEVDPEYLAFREDMSFLETRLMELENILRNAELIKLPPKKIRNKVVTIGATVTVEVNGQEDEFTLVSSLEANPSVGKISIESPVGRALLNRRIGENVLVSSPIQITYKIKKISYHLN